MKSGAILASVVFAFATLAAEFSVAKIVRYELDATQKTVNLSGKKTVDFAIMLNGQIPAPTLEFTEGDIAEIVVTNRVENEELSVHWHGLLLPPEMDGVPYVTTPPIRTGESYTFRFPLRQFGTYWYHSHTATQEQKGVYGAFVVHPKSKKQYYDHEAVVVISDWTDENPDRIIKNLRKDGEYYAYKKNTVRSYWGALRAGELRTYLANEWMRMGGMDLSDVGYDAFLINGRRDSQLIEAQPGETVLIRLINASASSYFYVSLGQTPMQVIAADGMNIEPIQADQILMATAETFDVAFTVPDSMNYELRATAQDGTGKASAWIGQGNRVNTTSPPPPELYAPMDHGSNHSHARTDEHHGHHGHHGHGEHTMSQTDGADGVIKTLTVNELKSPSITAFPKSAPVREFILKLGGDMERYVWTINGQTINQKRTITVDEKQVIRFVFENETMMHHPFHLHGHFFRVLNDQGESSPLKHTVDVPPHGRRVIEFYTNEPGDWMLHCHNLYHFKSGMARVVSYASFQPSPEIQRLQHHDPHLMDHVYPRFQLEAATGHAQAESRFSRSWDALDLRFETRKYDNLDHAEGDILYRRWFSQYFTALLGGSHFSGYDRDTTRAVVGFGYTLPLLLETEVFLDHVGDLRLELERRFQWTSSIFTDAEVSFRQGETTEYELTLMYGPRWSWAAGLMLTEDDLGFGLQVQF